MEGYFGRLITAVVTPFDERGEINEPVFRQLLRFLVENGSDGVVVAGTTGEAPVLSEEEKLRLFDLALEEIGGTAKVIAGTCTYNTQESIRLSREAEKLGVHGILAVAPYYNRPPQEGLYRHFRAIAEAVNLPIMLYNIPSRTGVNIEPETVARLAEIGNIVALKEASGSPDQLSRLAMLLPQGFSLYSGDDNMTLVVLTLGGVGVVSVASHLVGQDIKQMILAFEEGKMEEARAIHLRLYPLFRALFLSTNPIPVKRALQLLGFEVGEARPPLCSLEKEKEEKLLGVLRELGLVTSRV
ncbi:4-hydroxy-tetrahydrodipicolinate synthase [Candidatus Caldatribacterium saccharofermentans]|uniref:4-hydroxy-tetrahydrodipicolinate synthase n=1 Tax=Candidatus Caldatribacterium saccharofermentans TaxID=1454753 RepID=A0A7V4TGA0_9BACT